MSSKWQPIETAPRDISIDLYVYAESHAGRHSFRECDCNWSETWKCWINGLGDQIEETATHWMPRPEPPGQ